MKESKIAVIEAIKSYISQNLLETIDEGILKSSSIEELWKIHENLETEVAERELAVDEEKKRAAHIEWVNSRLRFRSDLTSTDSYMSILPTSEFTFTDSPNYTTYTSTIGSSSTDNNRRSYDATTYMAAYTSFIAGLGTGE